MLFFFFVEKRISNTYTPTLLAIPVNQQRKRERKSARVREWTIARDRINAMRESNKNFLIENSADRVLAGALREFHFFKNSD